MMLPVLRLMMLTMFFKIENDYYRQQCSSKPYEIWTVIVKIRKFDEICTDKT